jgi:hypothetical protein
VENISDTPLQYVYVSIWPGIIPLEEGRMWREACDRAIKAYEARGYPSQPTDGA